ncbi:MAG: ATP synthase F1 subunit delta [Pyrinomonadaceae bacterium]|nr:ATP synthase F1 subunit delta [Pyrinomonadaceae bacterium]
MSSQTVARRYAAALADVLVAGESSREIQDELIAWESMVQSAGQLQQVFGNPTVAYEQKRGLLEELIKRTKVQRPTANFLRILLKNQRLTELGEINKRLEQVLDERSGVVAAQVTTARPVSEEIKKSLNGRLAAITGKNVRLSFAIDETLIGGMVTRVGSTVYDGSIRNQLRELQLKLAGK